MATATIDHTDTYESVARDAASFGVEAFDKGRHINGTGQTELHGTELHITRFLLAFGYDPELHL